MKRKIIALLLAGVLLFTLMCGCGKDEPLTVTLRTMSTLGDPAEYDVYSSILAEFSAGHPDIYIRDTSVAASEAYRLGADKAKTYTGSSAPHVVYFTAEGGLSAMNEYFVSVEEIREIYPDFASGISQGALDAFRQADGRTYCVPIAGEWTAVVADSSVFARFSLDIPRDWDSLVNAVSVLSANGIIPFANSADDTASVLEILVNAYGGADTAALGLDGYSNIIDDCWTPALTDLAQLFRCGAFAPAALSADLAQELTDTAQPDEEVSASDVSASDAPADEAAQAVSDSDLLFGHPFSEFPQLYDAVLGADRDRSIRTDAFDLFNQGKAAMIIIDSSEFSRINYTDSCSVMPFPVPSGCEYSGIFAGGFRSGFAITRRAFSDPGLQEAAAALVDSMTGTAAAAQFASLGYLPANTTEKSGFTGAVGSLLAYTGTESFSASTRTGADIARWNTVDQLCARLYYQLSTPFDICYELSDPELIWNGYPADEPAGEDSPPEDTAGGQNVSCTDTFSE